MSKCKIYTGEPQVLKLMKAYIYSLNSCINSVMPSIQ